MEIRVCLLCWIKKVRKEKGKQRFEKTQTNVTITNHRWKSEKHTASNLFTTEVVWSESTAVGIEADGWTEVQAEKTNSICSPMRQRRFQRYRIWTRDTAHNRCPVEESLSLCSFFFVCLCVFFRPRKAGDKTMAVGGSRGRVPGSQTHTHTSKHFISITNHSVRNMNGLMHKIRSVRGCYSETFWLKRTPVLDICTLMQVFYT